MTQVIKETLRYMWRSEKNKLFMVLSTTLVLLYSLFILPNISGEKEIDLKALEREMNGNVVQFEDALKDGLIVPNILTGTTSYSTLRKESVLQREVLTALKQGDVERYISIPYRPESLQTKDESGLEQMVFNILAYKEEQPYQAQKNQVYVNEVEQLSFHTIHDRTSLQQIHLFMLGLGPVLLLLGLIFLISDIHVKDRSLQTQKIAVPMKWQKYLLIQTLTAIGFVSIFYLFLFSTFFILNGIQYGFGSFNLPIGYHEPFFTQGYMNLDNYQVQTIGWFMLRSFPYLGLLIYLFARLNTLLSLWTRQSVVTMALGIFMILFKYIYYGSNASELAKVDVSYFPPTYIDFGKIITGRFEFQILKTIPNLYSRGLIVLLITILIIELLTYLTSKKITRQIFVS